MDWFDRSRLVGPASSVYDRLHAEGIIWDPSDPKELKVLREDAARIAADMDDPSRPPPMFWSGIPWPAPAPMAGCDYQLVISIGGTKTDFAFLRLDKGSVHCLDVRTGREVSDPKAIEETKTATQMPTPKCGPAVPTGESLVAAMVRHFKGKFGGQKAALERCEAILMSWGFPHRVIRTGPRIAGGLTARVTLMTKDQAGFTDLIGKDVDVLLDREFKAQMGWSRPIAVANDTVMALHYFLDPDRRKGHGRVGLFINGTGTNFSAAEPYTVRKEGFISKEGEDYGPERIRKGRDLRPDEREELFFVNYEAGSIELQATRTRFDVDREYPIERNALAGGNAFPQMLRLLTEEMISKAVYGRIRESWLLAGNDESAPPGAPVVSSLSSGSAARDLLQGIENCEQSAAGLRVVARAIVARSALHAALVLAAATLRTGFGLGTGGLPDLLGMEGSIWKIPGYADLVKGYWGEIAGKGPLSVDLAAEPSYNASLSGPLYLAAIHRPGREVPPEAGAC
jgi:hypothetical protein